MELIDNFNTNVWQKVEDPSKYAFKSYTLIQKPKMVSQGTFQYAAKQLTDEGDIPHLMVTLEGASGKTHPLKSVRNCELVVENEKILAINLDGDCVVQKCLLIEK